MIDHDRILNSTKQWLSDFVIERNLCPFAKREYISNTIRFFVSDVDNEVDLLEVLYKEINLLVSQPETNTTLLIHPNCLVDFNEYNQFLDLTQNLLEQFHWQGEFQIASFHPHYQFADTRPDAAENFTNRSPYPILHILREAQVEKAIESYPNIEQVPQRNIELMNMIGTCNLQTELMELQK